MRPRSPATASFAGYAMSSCVLEWGIAIAFQLLGMSGLVAQWVRLWLVAIVFHSIAMIRHPSAGWRYLWAATGGVMLGLSFATLMEHVAILALITDTD